MNVINRMSRSRISAVGSWTRYSTVILLLQLISGCALFPPGPESIHQSEWKYLRVVYFVRDGDGVRPESWSTTNPDILLQLKTTFPTNRMEYASKPGLRKDNRIDIALSNGQKWVITYHPQARSLAIEDYAHRKRTYDMTNVGADLLHAISRAVLKETGVEIRVPFDGLPRGFFYDYSGPDASSYEYNLWPKELP